MKNVLLDKADKERGKGKRRSTWCRPVFYDECNHAVAALYDYVTKSRKA